MKLLLPIFHGSFLKRQRDMDRYQENKLHFVPTRWHWTTDYKYVYRLPQEECSCTAVRGTTGSATANSSNRPPATMTLAPRPSVIHCTAVRGTTGSATANSSNRPPATMTLAPRPSVIRYVHHKQRPVQKRNNQTRPQCPICNNTFSKPGSLKVHMRTHTGEKPFKCLYCSKAFNQSGSLISHVRTHTGEKPFKCPFCDRRFTQSSSQKNHVMTHLRKTLSMAEDLREGRFRSVTG